MTSNLAIERIRKASRKYRELTNLAQIGERLVPVLFSGSPLELPPGTPRSLDGIAPLVSREEFQDLWVHVCHILGNGGDPKVFEGLVRAAQLGTLQVWDQLHLEWQVGLAPFVSLLESQKLDVPSGVLALRLCSLSLIGSLALSEGTSRRITSTDSATACEICGNMPLLAELRGLEQDRWLRCGWCAAEKLVGRIECPYCGNLDHRQLRDFVLDEAPNGPRLNWCDSCQKGIRSLPTFSRLSPAELLAADIETMMLQFVEEPRKR